MESVPDGNRTIKSPIFHVVLSECRIDRETVRFLSLLLLFICGIDVEDEGEEEVGKRSGLEVAVLLP